MLVKHGREIALVNDRFTQEMDTARAIQIRLLPSSQPRVPGFGVIGANTPAALLMSNLQASLPGQVLHGDTVASVAMARCRG